MAHAGSDRTKRRERGTIQETVMVCCVTDEVDLVASPLITERADHVHLIHYAKEGKDEQGKKREEYYRRFYGAVEKRLKDSGIGFEEHGERPTFVFSEMMGTVYGILTKEEELGNNVYVNLSSGTAEYIAAASICQMMFDNVTLFTAAKAYDNMTTDFQKLLKSRTVDGELVGSCFASGKTFAIERYPVRRPDRNLLMALRVYHTIQNSSVQCTNTVVIRNLVLKGLWMAKEGMTKGLPRKETSVYYEVPEKGYGCLAENRERYMARQRSEAVLYARNYIAKWHANGWIEPIGSSKKYRVTKLGETALGSFCPEEVFSFGEEDIAVQRKRYIDSG